MNEVNKHGLSRVIPDATKREVRQRCGFGCVNCGKAVYQYEHVDPEFADAQSHDPKCIVLLCGGCHDLVTRGLLSKETVKARALTPKCKELGFSFGPFDIGDCSPEIIFGPVTARNCKTLIRIVGDDVFSVLAPSEAGQPFILNARFFDSNGTAILDIVENEWRSASGNWDVEVVGQRIRIRRDIGDLALVLRSEPRARIVIEQMAMLHKGIRISCRENKAFQVTAPDGTRIQGHSGIFEDCDVVIDANTTSIGMGRGGSLHLSQLSASKSASAPGFKAPRNAPCPCGSGVKYKKCHGKVV